MSVKQKRMTVDDIMGLRPCEGYSRERVEELWDGKDSLTICEILALPIPERDRLWVVLRPGILSYTMRLRFACDCGERVVTHCEAAGRTVDVRSADAVRVARRYSRGEATRSELVSAREKARSAAENANAAYDAAYDAAAVTDAAYAAAVADAAYAVVDAAAYDAAYAAPGAASYADATDYDAAVASANAASRAEREWQVSRLIELLESEEVKP